MATYRILYWQDIPAQVHAEDQSDEVTLALADSFMQRIDQAAAQRGLQGTDDYLAQWRWSDEAQRDGDARAVAEAVKAEIETSA